MSNNFITNSETKDLKRRINELIKQGKELKFLVGFFYFSGLKELYESIKENPEIVINVLVGLNVDKINNRLIEYSDLEGSSNKPSNNDIFQKFIYSLKQSINTEIFDSKEFYAQSKYFIQIMKEGHLIIRKTIKPNHSKLYIFELLPGQVGRQNLFITGSSNLTKAGLITQEEFNVEISDYGVDDAENYFNDLWERSVKLTEEPDYMKRLIELLEKETLIKEITPYEAYLLILKIYLDSYQKEPIGDSLIRLLESKGYKTYKYQLDAIEQALSTIEMNNGVILADVVGLGKTIIACAVARELRKRGVIICPPALMGDARRKDAGWNMYKEQFGLYDWEVWSSGDLDNLQNSIKKSNDFEVVIVDEAHKFRNQDTQSYELLKNICRNKKVILLTATPFNNRPADILSLLKLFITPKKSSITLENNLVDKFRSFKTVFDQLAHIKKYYNSTDQSKKDKSFNYYKTLFGEDFNEKEGLQKVKSRSKYLAKQIRDVIEPVTIRRNRLDLQNNPFYKDEVQTLSTVADPKEWFFELTEEQSSFYDTVIKQYFANPDEGGSFKGAIYRPFEYEAKDKILEEKLSEKENFEFLQQRNLYDFMRRLLVKRFESSFGSFEQSLKNFKHITNSVLEFIEKTGRYILDRELLERIYDRSLDEIEKYLLQYEETITKRAYPKNYKIYKLSDFKYKEDFLSDIKSDLQLFDRILEDLQRLNLINNDPKTSCLIKNLKQEMEKEAQRKIVIFSEYADTVKYLKPYLEKSFEGAVLTVSGDLLSSKKFTEIYENFDASYPEQENQYHILLTTDILSEGFNLNRAGLIVNYDIPWNPVRVIQRVGRINRVSKKVFDKLYIINFFPTVKGSELVKSREIASNKMFLIHNTLGEDSKIFDVDEEPTPAKLFEKIQQNPDKMEEEGVYTKVLQEFCKAKENNPDLINSLDKFPPRVKVAKKYKENELLVFIKKGRLYIHKAGYRANEEPEFTNITFEEAFEKIVCEQEEPSLELSNNFWNVYERIKSFREDRTSTLPENSNEQKAINNLNTLLNSIQSDEIYSYRNFLQTLIEDIIDFGTLPDYTLRTIANLETKNEEDIRRTVKEIKVLKEKLGEDYLEKEKAKQPDLTKEIIVAVENQE